MISKNKQSRLDGFRILLAIPTAFALLLMFSFTSLEKTTFLLKNDLLQPTLHAAKSTLDNLQTLQQKPKDKKTTQIAQSIKEKSNTNLNNQGFNSHYQGGFPGGHLAWMNYLKSNFKLPPEATKDGVKGYIELAFYVSEKGEIKNPKVYKGISPAYNNEALRVIKMMPKWTPILQDGKPCSPMFHLDIMIAPDPAKENKSPIVTFGVSMGAGLNVTASDEDKPALLVEQNPEFKGGYDAMLNYLKENVKYPILAKESGIQGTAFVQFVISKTGKISKVKMLRGIGGGCDEEAIRVVNAMPDWIPGRNDGKAVTVMFQIPIKFSLKAD